MSGIFKKIHRNKKRFQAHSQVILSITFNTTEKNEQKVCVFDFEESDKRKNTRYLKREHWIFKCSFIWNHILWCLLDFKTFDTLSTFFLNVKPCKLCNNKYMIASTQITNTKIFAFISVLVFNLLNRKVVFVKRKDNINCWRVGYLLRK